MSTITGERQAVISHPIGPNGTLILRTVRGTVRVRATNDQEPPPGRGQPLPSDGAPEVSTWSAPPDERR